MGSFDPIRLLIIMPPLLFSLCFHEFAHAWMAYQLGDNTARDQGRLTLNPLYHLDFFGTLMVVIVYFGWAKPVPVNPLNFKEPDKGLMLSTAAGPISNLILAVISGLLLRILIIFNLLEIGPVFYMLCYFVIINLALAIFNMFPLPPLDGSKILMYFTKMDMEKRAQFEHYGPTLLIVLIIVSFISPNKSLNIFKLIIWPLVNFLGQILTGLPNILKLI